MHITINIILIIIACALASLLFGAQVEFNLLQQQMDDMSDTLQKYMEIVYNEDVKPRMGAETASSGVIYGNKIFKNLSCPKCGTHKLFYKIEQVECRQCATKYNPSELKLTPSNIDCNIGKEKQTRLYGKVYDENNIVGASVQVVVSSFDENGIKTLFKTTTKANGSYEFINLPEGYMYIDAKPEGKEDCAWEMPFIELTKGVPQECDIVVPEMGELECTIIGIDDNVLRNPYDGNVRIIMTKGHYASNIRVSSRTYSVEAGLWIIKALINEREAKSVSIVVRKGKKEQIMLDINDVL